MIDLERFEYKLLSFPSKYMADFDNFWKWKLKVEIEDAHILDDNHRRETYSKLRDILAQWKAYRNSRNFYPWRTLEFSLETISNAYDQIRMYDLLEFSVIPDQLLKLIWHELGRVKEYNGNRNDTGRYYIISVCKPLMLLWGQTLAFDSHVRENTPYYVPQKTRWTFREWKMVMERFQESLQRNSEIVDSFKEKSRRKYGTESIVPYGRFLDIYYF